MLKTIKTKIKKLAPLFAAAVFSVGAFGTTAYAQSNGAQNNGSAAMTLNDLEAFSAQYREDRARHTNRDNRAHDAGRYDNRRYNDNRNRNDRNRSNDDGDVLGSIVGGTLGAIIGNEIGGDEGAVLGAILGGTVGYTGGINNNNRRYRANDHGSWGYGNRGYRNQGYGGYGFNQAARCNFEIVGTRYDHRSGQYTNRFRKVCFNSRGRQISSQPVR